jgi:hypothetical protein
MKCPDGLTWIPDREYCSRCQPGYAWNAQWGECVKMDRTVINPGQYHTASAAFFGYDLGEEKKKTGFAFWFLLAVIILIIVPGMRKAN